VDHADADQGFDVVRVSFVVFVDASPVSDPAEGQFDDRAFRECYEMARTERLENRL